MTYPDYTDPETWGRALVAYTDADRVEAAVARCRSVPHLRAAVHAEAERAPHAPRQSRIARLNTRLADLTQ